MRFFGFETADVLMVFLSAAMVAVLALGAVGGAVRAGVSASDARRLGQRVFSVIGAWLVLAAALAMSGALATSAPPPRWPLLPLTAFVTIAVVTRSASGKRVLSRVPPAWPIATQTFRVGVELAIYALYAAGRAPVQITFEGRNFDVLVGLSAPLMGWLVATNRAGPKAALAWNMAGLAMLANTVATVATSTPGPLYRNWPGAPFTAITTWPVVWLPAFLMPTAVFLHVVSLGQSVGRIRADRTD